MRKQIRLALFSLSLLLAFSNFLGAQNKREYSKEIFVVNNDTLQYRMLLPRKFSKDKKYPVVLILHGAGERGNDNQKQLVHGSALFSSKKNMKKFPAIVIYPQCTKDSYWSNASVDRTTTPLTIGFKNGGSPTKSLNMVMQLMETLRDKSYVDVSKMYVGGLSMGGMGTFEILYRKRKMFAAAFAICGGGNIDTVEKYAKNTALWVFHGANDDVVAPQLSIDMVSAYLKAGGKPNFNLYENDNHNSWDSAFSEPELLPWLFSKSKTNE